MTENTIARRFAGGASHQQSFALHAKQDFVISPTTAILILPCLQRLSRQSIPKPPPPARALADAVLGSGAEMDCLSRPIFQWVIIVALVDM